VIALMRHHHRLVTRGIWSRYAHLLLLGAAAAIAPMPVDRDAILICAALGLLANGVVHIYMASTREHAYPALALAALDAAVFLFVIRMTGMLASPFILLYPAILLSSHFVFLNRRVAIGFDAAAIGAFILAAVSWWWLGGAVPSWTVREYPWFAAFVIAADLGAIGMYSHLAFEAGPLASGLERQGEVLRAQEQKERLGTSLFAVAHELKTHLDGLRLNRSQVEMLATDLPESFREESAGILDACRGAEEEVEDLLDGTIAYARDRLGEPVFAPVPAAALLREAAAFTKMRYGAKAGEVRLGTGVPGLGVVTCDRTWIHQALADLAGNAFSRRQAGGTLTVEFDGVERGSTIILTVRDNGREMLPDELAALAGPGVPGPDETAGEMHAPRIARRIVEEHGGSLTLDSKPGRGVSFFVILPRGGPPAR